MSEWKLKREWTKSVAWGLVKIVRWLRGEDVVWNIYVVVKDKEARSWLSFQDTRTAVSGMMHGGVTNSTCDAVNGWEFGNDYDHDGDWRHNQGHYTVEFYMEDADAIVEELTKYLEKQVFYEKALGYACVHEGTRGEYAGSKRLCAFNLGDSGTYLWDYEPAVGIIPHRRFEITKEEAEALVEPYGEDIILNKKFVCVKDTEDETLFVYHHDFKYWLCQHENLVKDYPRKDEPAKA